jgi:farnesyl-diphosphate farnesyltransferase
LHLGRQAVKSVIGARRFETTAVSRVAGNPSRRFASTRDTAIDNVSAADRDRLLGPLLKAVSRSFYLSLKVLPGGLRPPVSLAYLLARAGDTIADTRLLPPARRLELLLAFRAQVNGAADAAAMREVAALTSQQQDSGERELLQSLETAVALLDRLAEGDRAAVREVVTTLTQGMEMDLRAFPPEDAGQVAALKDLAELDRYTYLVAGCVGAFWTRITMAHVPAMRGWDAEAMSACGVRFGKALQMTNVLRDVPRDLRIGRCYLPADRLAALGLRPEDLLDPATSGRARPVLAELLRVALGHYAEAERYILSIPRRCGRLRMATLWPVLIGLPTLAQLARKAAWLDPAEPVMVPTPYVKRMLALSWPAVHANGLVRRRIGAKMKDLAAALDETPA